MLATLRRYREFLKLEYPRYYWNPNYEPWIPADTPLPAAGEPFPRAVAKALYGNAYYDEPRVLLHALKRFAQSVEAAPVQSVVCIVFALGDGTGSGIVVDLARHLSNVEFGRRLLVVGLGIAPCAGDPEDERGASLFPVLNELDCMADQKKNEGVITVWGELYRNPFTGGFLVVPQEHVWQATRDLGATRARVSHEIASFLTRNHGTDLWETLRLLNWVGAPPTQHSAARTQYGERWAHMLGFADRDGPISVDDGFRTRIGLRSSYRPEFIEIRGADKGKQAKACAAAVRRRSIR